MKVSVRREGRWGSVSGSGSVKEGSGSVRERSF